MKRLLFSAFLLLSGGSSFSQNDLWVSAKEERVGYTLAEDNAVSGLRHSFSKLIYNASLNTTTGSMIIEFRDTEISGTKWKNSGAVFCYDIKQRIVKWSKKVNYEKAYYKQFNNQLFEITGERSYHINVENGKRDMELYGLVFAVNKAGIGIVRGANATIQVVDLFAKKMIWQMPIDNEFDWSNLKWLSDSELLITADGLYGLNVHTGEMWSYPAVTSKKDFSATTGARVAGVALRVLTRTNIPPIEANITTSIASPPLADSAIIYFASKENISALSRLDGKVIWTKPLPGGITSNSTLFVKDHFLYMVNRGYANKGGQQISFGIPFIAKFEIETGNEIFLKTVGPSKMIRDFDVKEEVIMLVFDESIVSYAMNDGRKIMSEAFDKLKYGGLKYCISEQIYRQCNDLVYRSITLSDSSKTYVYTGMRKVIEVNNELVVSDQWGADHLGIFEESWHEYKLLRVKDETIVLNKEGMKVATLNMSGAILYDNKLYDIQEKSVVEINLSEMGLPD